MRTAPASGGFVWCGGQGVDGMSVGRLVADPELRAHLDAWMAKFAAPGMCNPADDMPTMTPDDAAAERDSRSYAQRQHDAVKALVRGQLGDPKLGRHNGLPVTVIATATVQDLQARAGHAVTAGGTLIPIPDLIRMSVHANQLVESGAEELGQWSCFFSRRWPVVLDAYLSPVEVDSVVTCNRLPPQRGVA